MLAVLDWELSTLGHPLVDFAYQRPAGATGAAAALQPGRAAGRPGARPHRCPIDLDLVRNMYDIRAALEGLAFRKAAEQNPERARKQGPVLIQKGRKAAKSGPVSAMINADIKFHDFIYELSRNPMIAPTIEAQWTYIRRVMGEVLMRDEKPRDIWDQHEALLEAVMAGDADRAEALAREHITEAPAFMINSLQAESRQETVAA